MANWTAMCEDTNNAKLNRERIKQGATNQYYDEQAHAVAQWRPGELKPESVILGSLPYAGKLGRCPRDTELDSE